MESEITFENINLFLKNYPHKKDSCPHNFTKDFEQIGNMSDNSYGFLSYLDFKTEDQNEVFIGSYPYNSAKLWKCKECNYLTFSYTNDSGWGQLVPLKIDFNKEYLTEPANKSVSIKPINILEFVELFGLTELISPENISDYPGTKLISKNKTSIFRYKIQKTKSGDTINFEIVANRDLLRKIAAYEQKQ